MPELGGMVEKVRSKNAGPFWVTIDVFCGSSEAYSQVCSSVSTKAVAELFRTGAEQVKRFEIPSLNVVKFSVPRPVVQGTRFDRDMHGAAWAALVSEMQVAE